MSVSAESSSTFAATAAIFSCVTAWTLMVLPTAISMTWYGGGLHASWWFCTIYIIVLGLGFLARFQAGHWKKMRVIETPAGAPVVGD